MKRAAERGSVAVELSAGVALLVLPIALLVLAIPDWAARQNVARLAAHDAARVVGMRGVCDRVLAEEIVADVAGGAGLDTEGLRVVLDCAPSAPLVRDGAVTARVTVDVAAVSVPVLGHVAGWSWTAVHREPIDPYASRP